PSMYIAVAPIPPLYSLTLFLVYDTVICGLQLSFPKLTFAARFKSIPLVSIAPTFLSINEYPVVASIGSLEMRSKDLFVKYSALPLNLPSKREKSIPRLNILTVSHLKDGFGGELISA